MTITLRPEHEELIAEAIRVGVIQSADEVLEVGLEAIRNRIPARGVPAESQRTAAVRRMREFGDKYRLSLNEPVTRRVLHEEHRH